MTRKRRLTSFSADQDNVIQSPTLSRRQVVRGLGTSLAALPVLAACGDDSSMLDASTDTSSSTDGTFADSTTSMDTSSLDTGSVDSSTTDTGTVDGWATGGTAAMVASASYPDPFESGSSTCAVQCTTTIGPCHTTSPERQDVSDGWDGLPVRLAIKLVGEDGCSPLEDTIVEIWHTNYHGIYSGNIASMCNSEAEDRAAEYFRGYQRTDADGRVNFDTVFPGWYSGRAVHIHFRVQTGTYAASDSADAEVISQLFFPEELTASIFGDEPLYSDYGQPDTSLASDNVIGGEDDMTPYIVDYARMSDGAMLASKTVTVMTGGTSCSASGSGGGGGGPGRP